MSQPVSLKEAERKAFTTSYNDGLWDIFLGCIFSQMAIAPYLGASLGDFWGSVVFLPVWGLVYLIIWLLRKYVVMPRIGLVKFGQGRVKKLAKFTSVMLVINVLALILGLLAAANFERVPGQMMSIVMGLTLLVGFSIVAYILDFNRLYLYGLLIGISPLIGEWLWNLGYVTHHGFPVTFGTASGIMILSGLVIFFRLLKNNPVPVENTPTGEV